MGGDLKKFLKHKTSHFYSIISPEKMKHLSLQTKIFLFWPDGPLKVIQWTHRCGSIRFVLTQPVYAGHCDIDPVILVEYVNGPADPGLLGLS